MQHGSYKRIDVREIQLKKRENKKVRIGKSEEEKIVVQVKTVKRDNREMVEKDGKQVKNKRFGLMVYETAQSLDVFDSTPEEVFTAIGRGLRQAVDAAPQKAAQSAARK